MNPQASNITTAKAFTFNWGHGLLLFLLLFLSAMVAMVIYASKQDNPMMDDHYYEKELAYQGIIDAQQNLEQVSQSSIFMQDMQSLLIQLPQGTYASGAVTLALLRQDATVADIQLELQADDKGLLQIAKTNLKQGLYTARVSWKNGPTPYYATEKIFIQ